MNLATIRAAFAALTGRPQPVLTRAGIVSVVAGLAALLIHFNGGSVSAWLNVNKDAIAGFVLFIAPTVSGFLAKSKVTPVSDPKAADGTPLVPAGTVNTVQVIPADPVAFADLIWPAPVAPASVPEVSASASTA